MTCIRHKNCKSINQDMSNRCALELAARSNKCSNKMEHNQRYYLLSSVTSPRIRALFCLSAVILALISININFAHVTCQQLSSARNDAQSRWLPDLTSATSTEPILAVVGQDAFVSCVAKNLQNYTIIWRYTNDANAPAALENNKTSDISSQNDDSTSGGGIILTAGRQRVTSDDRFSIIQSHDTWLLKISNVKLADTGTYICHTNSQPRVRALRILSVIKPSASSTGDTGKSHRCSLRRHHRWKFTCY